MKERTEVITNETADLSTIANTELLEIFGAERSNIPAILMFDEKKVLPLKDVVNLASGENVPISEVLNMELTLEGFGAVKLDYVNEDTGEFGTYIRYILITDKGNFTTTSTFIGRTLKMLYQTAIKSPKIRFIQKEKQGGHRQFKMELL